MMQNTAKLLDEIAELKEYKHRVGKALARIENWQKAAPPSNQETIEEVLDILKEEGVSE